MDDFFSPPLALLALIWRARPALCPQMMRASFGEVSGVLESCSMRLKRAAYEMEELKKELPELRTKLWKATMETMDLNADIISAGVTAMIEPEEQ